MDIYLNIYCAFSKYILSRTQLVCQIAKANSIASVLINILEFIILNKIVSCILNYGFKNEQDCLVYICNERGD